MPVVRGLSLQVLGAMIDEAGGELNRARERANVFLGQLRALERARPMCSDHRDKFGQVPCIACHFEAALAEARQERDKAYKAGYADGVCEAQADIDEADGKVAALTHQRDEFAQAAADHLTAWEAMRDQRDRLVEAQTRLDYIQGRKCYPGRPAIEVMFNSETVEEWNKHISTCAALQPESPK